MVTCSKLFEFLDKRRKKQHNKIRTKVDALKREEKKPVKKGWGSMVNTGYGGINKNPIDRVYDIAQQQKNLSHQKGGK